jgi:hypothetical protein
MNLFRQTDIVWRGRTGAGISRIPNQQRLFQTRLMRLGSNVPRLDDRGLPEIDGQLPRGRASESIIVVFTTSTNPGDEAAARRMQSLATDWLKPLNKSVGLDILKRHFPEY